MTRSILIQLDTDSHPSVFDRVVAFDAGIDEQFCYGGITPADVTPLVHGAMFTRGGEALAQTAIFVGGSQVKAGEAVLKQVEKTFFPGFRVSVMLDSNGCNTTAAAAVIAAGRHLTLSSTHATVLGATGPVGERVARLLASQGATVQLVSRSQEKADLLKQELETEFPEARLIPLAASSVSAYRDLLQETELIVAAGAAGVEFLPQGDLSQLQNLKVAIDLNAVPPCGLGDIQPPQKATTLGNVLCYGALGVGGTKMKLHKAALQQLFTSTDLTLDTAAIYDLGVKMDK